MGGGWDKGDPGCFGFKFTHDGGRHYGWGRMTIDATTAGQGFIISEACYETITNRAIRVGAAPTAVTMSGFQVETTGGVTRVSWSTSQEDQTVGFYLYRLVGTEWVKVNDALIPAQNELGGDYEVTDAGAPADERIIYRLVEIETTGAQKEYGPYASGSGLKIGAVPGTTDERRFCCPSVLGEEYQGLRAPAITGPYDPITDWLPATPPLNTFIDPNPPKASCFYRIEMREIAP